MRMHADEVANERKQWLKDNLEADTNATCNQLLTTLDEYNVDLHGEYADPDVTKTDEYMRQCVETVVKITNKVTRNTTFTVDPVKFNNPKRGPDYLDLLHECRTALLGSRVQADLPFEEYTKKLLAGADEMGNEVFRKDPRLGTYCSCKCGDDGEQCSMRIYCGHLATQECECKQQKVCKACRKDCDISPNIHPDPSKKCDDCRKRCGKWFCTECLRKPPYFPQLPVVRPTARDYQLMRLHSLAFTIVQETICMILHESN